MTAIPLHSTEPPPSIVEVVETEAPQDLTRTLACGRGYLEEEAPPAPPKRVPWTLFAVGFLLAATMSATVTKQILQRDDNEPSIVVPGWSRGTFTVLRTAPILTGVDALDREWALVEQFYPDEAQRVLDIVLSDSNQVAAAWVEECEQQPSTVIFVNRSYLRTIAGTKIGEMLAHEMTHVTQCFDGQKADVYARQREAALREGEYAEKRRAYYRQLGIEGE